MVDDEAVPIVLLHGVGLDSSIWRDLEEAITAGSCRTVTAIDLPGHGSQPPLGGSVTLDDLVDDVAARVPDRMHMVGFSVGALIAARLVRRDPGRAATLTCVSSVYDRSPEQVSAVGERLHHAARDFPGSVEASLQRWFPTGTPVSSDRVEDVRRVLLANDVSSYLRVYEVFATADKQIIQDVPQLEVPVLAVTGSEDSGSTPEMSRRLADAAEDGRAVVVEGIRHMLPLEHPEHLAETLITFLDDRTGACHD
ncbi:alpha/beta fold hydrolase [Nesterenkonia xinjiangensis]|uniref:Pimeloyl-ACP methyl ester carboxylesterase n=1 Tax=Nesterenkonia xinjiangensis TaxID=225327 RepID=A0A7Z0GL66_9MICC|nr:alpha/beta fold hydrolase [Nesterenkonia xinjiangensis]NYJ77997.1 pimeloyl-ACP methyl ester carboxylesterase [Nesterenkonia xinjiangensis]